MLRIIDKKHFINNKFVYGFLVVAFLLRVIGIDYGYPYIFNIDEPAVIRSALGLRYTNEIGHFDWPHFTFYFNFIFYFIFIKLRGLVQIVGARGFLESVFPILWNDPFVFYFITRYLNALLGALTIVPVYLMSREMFSKRTALISAALFSVIPYHVYISHVAVPDALLLFFLAWALYFSYRFSKSLGYRDIILAAIMFGVSSGIKYNAIILSPFLVLLVFNNLKSADLIKVKTIKDITAKFIVFGFVSLLALLSTTPEIIFDWDVFWSYEYGRGFLWQLKLNSGPISLADYPSALIEQIFKIFTDTGFVILSLFVYSIYRTSSKSISGNEKGLIRIMAGIVVAFILFTSRYSHANSHYFLPVYSLLVVISAWGLNDMIDRLKSIKVAIVVLAILSVLSVYNSAIFLRGDTRNMALAYYEKTRGLGGQTYIDGQDLSEADVINNLNVKKVKGVPEVNDNDVIITQTAIENNDKIVLIETIGNFFRKGPIIYVYKKAL